ncbi:oxygenase MpaB family protein [Geodermatophilus sp. DSM 44513]|uniref:oxygenase MpaB family protein n=1 Tax=Geodermatophilus sp. DSM 44513 TaxID=1528104 RepID=UPI001278A372|nr:oxygenase MpaB family protein [Geodermatophilus sp. DSM 44513]WNV74717.1 oxygenase MpaB family protein [Geodermatophilus sp. DSM 44513]
MNRLPALRDFTAEEDLLGFFGPDSVSWRIHADPAFGVGGIRALLLQALHPVAMDGVATFSTAFTSDPWARLTRTAEYVATLTFGTRRDALRSVRRVRGLHRGKAAVEETTGRGYAVDDADLLLWVHCCEVDSLLSVARRAGVPLTDDDADRYVAEQVTAAVLVGCEAAEVPATAAELEAYLQRMRPQLAVTPATRDASRFVLVPPMPGWVQLLTPARPAWSTLAALGAATLPRWARQLYGLPGFSVTDTAATAAVRAFRQAALALPVQVRESPIVRAARERVAAAEELTA